MFQDGHGEFVLAAIVPVALVASWYDCRQHRVPNWLNASVALTGLGAQAALGGPAGLAFGFQGMLVGFGMLVLLWAMKGMGAGDVKLMAALGTWLGPQMTFFAVLVGGLVGGVVALGMIVYHRNWSATASNLGVLMNKVSRFDTAFSDYGSAQSIGKSSGVVPYAVPLSIGTLIVVLANHTGWWEVL